LTTTDVYKKCHLTFLRFDKLVIVNLNGTVARSTVKTVYIPFLWLFFVYNLPFLTLPFMWVVKHFIYILRIASSTRICQ